MSLSTAEEFELTLRAILDTWNEGDWDRMESLAESMVKLARRRRLETAANSAGVVNCGCDICKK
jgi:hypothetical protein